MDFGAEYNNYASDQLGVPVNGRLQIDKKKYMGLF